MATYLLIYGDNRSFSDILKNLIFFYSEIWKLIWGLTNIASSAWQETGLNNQIDWYIFCLERPQTFVNIIFCGRFEMKVGKWEFDIGCCWYSFILLKKFYFGILKLLCQKEPQEDERGGEGGLADNIGGELGSIPPYPTYIPPGPKKLFCRRIFKIS